MHLSTEVSPPNTEKDPRKHGVHSIDAFAPDKPPKEPAGQSRHAPADCAAVVAENFPAAQSVHRPAPSSAYFPGTHCVHTVLANHANVPAMHGVQLCVLALKINPAGHRQSDSATAAASVVFPAGQLVHTVAPPKTEYVAIAQS